MTKEKFIESLEALKEKIIADASTIDKTYLDSFIDDIKNKMNDLRDKINSKCIDITKDMEEARKNLEDYLNTKVGNSFIEDQDMFSMDIEGFDTGYTTGLLRSLETVIDNDCSEGTSDAATSEETYPTPLNSIMTLSEIENYRIMHVEQLSLSELVARSQLSERGSNHATTNDNTPETSDEENLNNIILLSLSRTGAGSSPIPIPTMRADNNNAGLSSNQTYEGSARSSIRNQSNDSVSSSYGGIFRSVSSSLAREYIRIENGQQNTDVDSSSTTPNNLLPLLVSSYFFGDGSDALGDSNNI
jgi:hypothetical protein